MFKSHYIFYLVILEKETATKNLSFLKGENLMTEYRKVLKVNVLLVFVSAKINTSPVKLD